MYMEWMDNTPIFGQLYRCNNCDRLSSNKYICSYCKNVIKVVKSHCKNVVLADTR